ncbi:hypothetical protein KC669_02280 [Candidatus Dojkabacteria bacterium]|uniref:Uncharacterized protein n=1 Tax=Candidatus Dojkabacteria bacterium TaxID=2099670 RepID=A0A955LB99_9BACT|nr:hypothetical protein [Candidatus Dojkabacteria bacterium]
MEVGDLMIGLLLAILVVNVFNIAMILRVARWLGSNDAFEESKAISLNDPFFKVYLMGPMVSWSKLKRTRDNKYWLDLRGWFFVRVTMFAVLTFLLFANIYLLLWYLSM